MHQSSKIKGIYSCTRRLERHVFQKFCKTKETHKTKEWEQTKEEGAERRNKDGECRKT